MGAASRSLGQCCVGGSQAACPAGSSPPAPDAHARSQGLQDVPRAQDGRLTKGLPPTLTAGQIVPDTDKGPFPCW
eukprot:1154657-Pelagomonas_calceolata.AAC.5